MDIFEKYLNVKVKLVLNGIKTMFPKIITGVSMLLKSTLKRKSSCSETERRSKLQQTNLFLINRNFRKIRLLTELKLYVCKWVCAQVIKNFYFNRNIFYIEKN